MIATDFGKVDHPCFCFLPSWYRKGKKNKSAMASAKVHDYSKANIEFETRYMNARGYETVPNSVAQMESNQ